MKNDAWNAIATLDLLSDDKWHAGKICIMTSSEILKS